MPVAVTVPVVTESLVRAPRVESPACKVPEMEIFPELVKLENEADPTDNAPVVVIEPSPKSRAPLVTVKSPTKEEGPCVTERVSKVAETKSAVVADLGGSTGISYSSSSLSTEVEGRGKPDGVGSMRARLCERKDDSANTAWYCKAF